MIVRVELVVEVQSSPSNMGTGQPLQAGYKTQKHWRQEPTKLMHRTGEHALLPLAVYTTVWSELADVDMAVAGMRRKNNPICAVLRRLRCKSEGLEMGNILLS